MNRFIMIGGLLLLPWISSGQDNEIDPDGYNIFYHANGSKSAEGYFQNGQPTGYWKNYYEDGTLRSEGNREGKFLDSTWIFYREDGLLKEKISYEKSMRHGYSEEYNEEGMLIRKVPYVNDTIEGVLKEYYSDIEKVNFEIPYTTGLSDGPGYEYAKDGRVISVNTYEKGALRSTLPINRYNKAKERQGLWIEYYEDDPDLKIKRIEGRYKAGLKNGYFREYDKRGELLSTTKYLNGQVIENVEELMNVEIVREYFPDAKVKKEKTYLAGKPHGVWKEYNDSGNVVNAWIYDKGILLGQGIVDANGLKQGPWIEYYREGEKRAEGEYLDGARIGAWKFFHLNGKIAQKGKYKEGGKAHGRWVWYFDNGMVLKEENYRKGLEDGDFTEYDSTGNELVRGSYIDGLEDGEWWVIEGDYRHEGAYIEGLMHGEWKGYYRSNEQLAFKGNYIEGVPDGKHVYYYDNGRKMLEGKYQMGLKQGDWKRYDESGFPVLTIYYNEGKDAKLDGKKVDLEEAEVVE
ncbi:MAG TPA: hypothetical protein DDX92_11920 [Flavobacteriales bacterium]|jgi:antitoxin component YwqK of YwqJK toxin-antitoxin module|nr:hypothetical protein [Flavobacteriales bacterium]